VSRITIRDLSRLIIASYFIGLGFGIFHGPEVSQVFEMLGAGRAAGLLGGAVVIVLASLVFLDIHRGLAVATLGFLIFFASYAGLIAAVGQSSLGSFWRDMAIIGLLLLALRRPAEPEDHAARKAAKPAPAPPAPEAQHGTAASPRPPHPRRVRTEIFRQDFDAVRAP
jgi:hypothetical protein